jgi:hypothetical protein
MNLQNAVAATRGVFDFGGEVDTQIPLKAAGVYGTAGNKKHAAQN